MNTLTSSYGLNKRIKLKLIDDNHIAIVKQIKSRILQKDALKIIDIAIKIREKDPDKKISLICNNNICSKSLILLYKENIKVFHSDI